MGHIFDDYVILSCVVSLLLFNSHFWSFITHNLPLRRSSITWYPRSRCLRLSLRTILIFRRYVPLLPVGHFQPFPICQVRVVTICGVFII